MNSINARQLLESWKNSGIVISSDSAKIEDFIQAHFVQSRKKKDLIYIFAVTTGAWITFCICFFIFLSFLYTISITTLRFVCFFCGLFFIHGALLILKQSKKQTNFIKQIIIDQSALGVMSVGKTLITLRLYLFFENNLERLVHWKLNLSMIIVTLATYHVFPMSIDRFLSTFFIFFLLFVNIVIEQEFYQFSEIALHIFFFIQIILSAILLTYSKFKDKHLPLTYATVLSLCYTLVLSVVAFSFQLSGNFYQINQTFMNFVSAMLTLSLIGLIVFAARDLKNIKTEPFVLAALASIFLGILSPPGVILSICLMVLGNIKHDKFFTFIGILLMPVFILLYYFSLDTNLMSKSGALIGSGIIFLFGRAYLSSKKLDRKELV
ncbi:DUF4401 domain-containing protein [Holospora obtusa]|nr:DUF4401 domain-containing protein [Holospora obtusa]